MTEEVLEYLRKVKDGFDGLNRTFITEQEVKIDIKKIKEELAKEMKRDNAGRSSYGIGV